MTGWIKEVHIRGDLGPWSMICFCDYRLDVALDYEIDITGKYSGSYFLEEIKGLADATGLDYKVYKYVYRPVHREGSRGFNRTPFCSLNVSKH